MESNTTQTTHVHLSHFDDKADQWDSVEYSHQLALKVVDSLLAIVTPSNITHIMDWGCGTGLFLKYLAERVPSMESLVGVDLSEKMIAKCNIKREVDPQFGKKSVFYNQNLTKEGLLDGRTFDVIVMVNVLHHVENPPEQLKILKTYLKPSGTIAIFDFIKDDNTKQFMSEAAAQFKSKTSTTDTQHGEGHHHTDTHHHTGDCKHTEHHTGDSKPTEHHTGNHTQHGEGHHHTDTHHHTTDCKHTEHHTGDSKSTDHHHHHTEHTGDCKHTEHHTEHHTGDSKPTEHHTGDHTQHHTDHSHHHHHENWPHRYGFTFEMMKEILEGSGYSDVKTNVSHTLLWRPDFIVTTIVGLGVNK